MTTKPVQNQLDYLPQLIALAMAETPRLICPRCGEHEYTGPDKLVSLDPWCPECEDHIEPIESSPLREAVGSLLWHFVSSRPDVYLIGLAHVETLILQARRSDTHANVEPHHLQALYTAMAEIAADERKAHHAKES